MSTETQLQIRSLARDSSGQLASQAGALRRAENIVIRAPGVAESRPNFEVLYEDVSGTTRRPMAIRYFANAMVAIERATGTLIWTARNLTSNLTIPIEVQPLAAAALGAYIPPSFDDCETQFAEARKNLYLTGKGGVITIDDPASIRGAQMSGVDMGFVTDFPLATRNWSTVTSPEATGTYAYRFVFVRKDAHGYTRRSPPSGRIAHSLLMVGASGVFGTGTRFYFPTATDAHRLAPGDTVECYRSKLAAGSTPNSEHFLAFTYIITATDYINGYFVPPVDAVADDDLGAALYTDPSQGGALAARYAPPMARAIAWWERVMWYGATTEKTRVTVELRNLFRAGLMRFAQPCTFVAGSAVVALADTTGMKAGNYFTDQYQYGPAVAGVLVPANTVIQSVDSGIQITLSANALANGTDVAGVMSPYAPQGIIAESSGNGAYTLGSAVVTGLPSTAGWRAGMYWTDNTTIGPTAAGTCVPAGTKIFSVDSGTQITMTANSLATNGARSARVGDIVTVYGVEYYAWIEYTGGGVKPYTAPAPWSSAFVRCFAIEDARYGEFALQIAVTNLVKLINYQRQVTANYVVHAIPSGDLVPDQVGVAGGSLIPPGSTNWAANLATGTIDTFARGFTIEERGVGYAAITVACTVPSAFNPALLSGTGTFPLGDTPTFRGSRLFWSDPDEPEAVRVTSYIDVGSAIYPIQALAALPDALLVFKVDGVYRVTGVAPSSWSVECIDATMRLVRPECVTVVNGEAYVWSERGFFAVSANGTRSLSAGALDNELRDCAQLVFNDTDCHGAFVCALRPRNLVLFGVPTAENATKTGRIYCLNLVTNAFTEWPLAWTQVSESRSDDLFYIRPPDSIVAYEVRLVGTTVRGYDRQYSLGSIVSLTGTTLVVTIAVAGPWQPAIGDMVSALGATASVRTYRRITEVSSGGGNYTLTLEDGISGTGALSTWRAYEMAQAAIVVEWHPTSPARIPTGALCREMQVQLDLRSWPNDEKSVSIPQYVVGGTSERDTSPHTVTSNATRVAQIQPLRVGCSRQIARSAMVAPYFASSDIFPLRINGLSLVYEGTSERTRR